MTNNYFKHAKRAVIKVGSNVLTASNNLNMLAITSISSQVSTLIDRGIQVLLVSSGAMAAGLCKMDMNKRPDAIPKRQAIAAIGQSGLMNTWEEAFRHYRKKVAQILLTGDDMNNRERYFNTRNTIDVLLGWKVIPIINENDTVKTDEIKLGDNDNLSAMLTLLMDADVLVNLSDIDGLFTKDPRISGDAELIPEITAYDKEIEKYAGEIPGALGTGGMLSKIRAAKKVTSAGVPMVIAKGDKPNILLSLFDGEPHGTYFVPTEKRTKGLKCWIAYTLNPKGSLTIDAGASKAVTKDGGNLLPSGIVKVDGNFGVGNAVTLKNEKDQVLAVGLVNYSARDTRAIMGLKTNQIQDCLGSSPYDEVVHRNNLVIIENT